VNTRAVAASTARSLEPWPQADNGLSIK
jgi:hypothetical protein